MTPQDALQTSCAGKGRFPTQQQAAERAQRMRHCHGWHIGGKRPDTVDGNKAFKRRRQQASESAES